MRVIHLIETLGRGGAEQALVNLLPALSELGIKGEVISLWGENDIEPSLREHGIPVHQVGLSHHWSLAEGALRLRRILRETQPDVIVGHLYFGHIYARFAQGPARISVFHNMGYDQSPPHTVWTRVRRALHRAAVRDSDAHVAVSQAAALSAQKHLRIELPAVIHNPFPLATLRPDPSLDVEAIRNELGHAPDDIVVITPSRLVPAKGLETLVRAVAQVRTAAPRLRLKIVGSGPLKQDLIQFIRGAGLEDRVAIHSSIPHAELMTWIQAADIVALPSHFEGLGLALAEGMAMERAVVGTRETGMADLVDDGSTGLLVPRGDVEALATALRQLSESDELRTRLGASARTQLIENFDAAFIARRWSDLLHKVVNA